MDSRDDGSVLRPASPITLLEKSQRKLHAVIGFGLPFLLITLLAVNGGGYDLIFRSQVGVIVWWVVLLGFASGILPLIRITRAGWIAVALFGVLVMVTALATLTWTESTERSMVELSRTLTIFGAFVLLLLAQAKEGLRGTVGGVGAAVAVVAVIALTDRFDASLLPLAGSDLLPANYPRGRLNFPLEYWNGLAALLAIGIGPLFWAACSAHSRATSALAAGAIPLVILATYMAASRGGIAAAAVALLMLVLFFPDRLKLLISSMAPAIGSMLLIVMINRRPEIRDLLPEDFASTQGTEMILTCAVVFLVTAGLQFALAVLMNRGILVLPKVSHEVTRGIGMAFAAATVAVVVLSLASGFVGDRWTEFKQPVESRTVSRLGTLNSGERYRNWDSALNAAASEKLTGIGPGTFEYWWAREGNGGTFVRDAHSLYLETLAEMGPVAFLIVVALVLGLIVYAFRLSVAHRDERRGLLVASGAGMVAFAIAAGVDWAWEMTVLPIMFFALAAAALGPDRESVSSERGPSSPRGSPSTRYRVVGVAASLAAIGVIALTLAGAQLLDSSQEEVRAGKLDRALDRAKRASELQPYAASPRIQEAQILQLQGRNAEGVELAREAVEKESSNWRNWFVLAQLLADSSPREARQAVERAEELNSGSYTLFPDD